MAYSTNSDAFRQDNDQARAGNRKNGIIIDPVHGRMETID
jgi:hypothetical protein